MGVATGKEERAEPRTRAKRFPADAVIRCYQVNRLAPFSKQCTKVRSKCMVSCFDNPCGRHNQKLYSKSRLQDKLKHSRFVTVVIRLFSFTKLEEKKNARNELTSFFKSLLLPYLCTIWIHVCDKTSETFVN